MTALDKSDAVKTLLEKYKNKNKVCKILGIQPSTLQHYLYYHGLPTDVKNYVDDGLINMQFAVNVFRKFSKNNAMDILYYFSNTKKHIIQRKLLLSAIKTADKKYSLYGIKQSIRKLESPSVSIILSLDSSELKNLQRIANGYKLSVDEISSLLLRKQIKKEI